MNLKKALPTITVILAVIAPGARVKADVVDRCADCQESWHVKSNVHYIFHVDYSGPTCHFSRSLPKIAH
jgi:predicted  nucleic acid-binding Zn ribbon protein